MSIKESIVWGATTLFGTLYVYKYGMKIALRDARLKKGLITKNDKEIYRNKKVFNFWEKIGGTLWMIFISFIIVVMYTAVFFRGTEVDLESFEGVILTIGYIFLSLNIFTTAKFSEEELKEQSSLFKWVINQCAKLKEVIVNGIVSQEYERLISKNKDLIKKWCNKDNLKTASLVEKINSPTFLNIMPNNITNESKEELKGMCKDIGIVLFDNKQDLMSELKKLFGEYLLELNMNICFITGYLYDHDEIEIDETLDIIKTRISTKVKKRNNRKNKDKSVVKNMDDLNNIVNAATGTDD